MKKYVLVTGGSGFIGSSVVDELLSKNYNVIVVDKNINPWTKRLATNNRKLTFLEKIITDIDVDDLVGKPIHAVIHLAANHVVSDSVTNPLIFYRNNLNSLLYLIGLFYPKIYSLKKASPYFIFSSSAAVYGLSNPNIIKSSFIEDDLTYPINSYGRTKLWGEQILKDCVVYGMKSISLRYFNVAGAGDNHGYHANKITHAIPILLNALKGGKEFTIFGNDYPTKDGTCIRDYLHVKDVAKAHVLALEKLENENIEYDVFNLGTGVGTSMIDLIHTTNDVFGVDIRHKISDRRQGDPPILVANAEKAKEVLKWNPTHNLENIIEDSWRWVNRDDWS